MNRCRQTVVYMRLSSGQPIDLCSMLRFNYKRDVHMVVEENVADKHYTSTSVYLAFVSTGTTEQS